MKRPAAHRNEKLGNRAVSLIHALRGAAAAAKRGAIRVASLLAADGIVARKYSARVGSAPFVLFFVGRERFAREFELYFSDNADRGIVPAATPFRGNLAQLALQRSRLAREAMDADFVACEMLPGAPEHEDDVLHYPMLDASLAVEPSLDRQIRRMRSSSGRRLMRQVVKRGEYRDWLATGPEAFDNFHTALHAPYVRARFGAWGVLDDVEQLRGLYRRRGRILFVAHRDRPEEPVSGTLLFDHGQDTLVYQLNGFADAGGGALIAERTAALEIALLKHAIGRRYARINLGYTRAILNDGLFVHKRRLGCTFEPGPGSPAFRVRVRASQRAAVFARFPLLVGGPHEWTAALGFDDEAPRKPKPVWRSTLKGYRVPGLAKAVVWTNARGDRAREIHGEPAFREAITETLDLRDGIEFRSDE
jgi:hypothetical protein